MNELRTADAQQVRQVMNDRLAQVGAIKCCGDQPRLEDKAAEPEQYVQVATWVILQEQVIGQK